MKLSKSMLIETGYPNLLHDHDFLCFNLIEIIINESENIRRKKDNDYKITTWCKVCASYLEESLCCDQQCCSVRRRVEEHFDSGIAESL